jgi:hypothetical protein
LYKVAELLLLRGKELKLIPLGFYDREVLILEGEELLLRVSQAAGALSALRGRVLVTSAVLQVVMMLLPVRLNFVWRVGVHQRSSRWQSETILLSWSGDDMLMVNLLMVSLIAPY